MVIWCFTWVTFPQTQSNHRNCSSDINECLVGNGGCWHSCHNAQGSFSCSCDPGYLLSENGFICLCMFLSGSKIIHDSKQHNNQWILNIFIKSWIRDFFQQYGFFLVINEVLLRDDPHNPCARALCIHGDCRPLANTYMCDCYWGYQGPHCGKG